MQIRALIYFDELVRTNSMRQAAENLNVAPTAISRQIENLEYHFGTPLVERSARGVKLTAAGELLAVRAGRTLRELDHVHQLIEDLKGLQRGRVSVYASGATVANLLAPALAEFSLRYPKLRFEVTITSARSAIEAVNGAEADIAVTLFAPPLSGTKVRLRSEITYDVIAATSHSLAAHKEVSLAELAAHSLAVPDRSFGARQAFDALFEREGLVLDPVFESSSLEMQKELVLRGAAITMLPALTVQREIQAGQLVALPVAGGKGIRTPIDLCVAPDRQLSFAAGKLLDFIERFMREQVAHKGRSD
ncbi:LysR family transcriptional regulator [Agrobacterium sp. 13-626]|uniref:LysR substrate-binding domain-containing protein n=1 Tax=Rhizobium rhizogenes TaxID=359 RepID=UPI0004D9DA0B|nr:LysR substrate-binding domain-containing protein [Rhizobium rhizogenes]OCJ03961.1 LysR family transcriptional regulator [Agrobacterium sp. 13-626]KEA04874.1 LysR family transcriptional regulator [Rhizobium rhizogenes]MQB34324.1 LysR family transcriptional regulator [Rhizobium rhizogenes]NTG39621.1 LysR family transcriptional regulator [Rhizobium rhizogenes]NTH43867.1 LysR family transcriptional regulator [Rhizobium rhizogenes]